MKWLKLISLIALGLYLAFTAIVYFAQRKFLYFPPSVYLTPAGVNLDGFTEIPLRSDTGDELLAWWSPPADEIAPVILFFHGNGSAVFSNHDIYRDLAGQGYGVLGAGYPGYPGSDGKPAQPTIETAARAHHAFLIRQDISTDRIVYFGTSLGSGIAAQLAEQHPPKLLIMDAPLPFLPVGWLMKDQYRSDKALKDLNMPLIWIHGTADRVIPLSQGQKLFDGYTGPKSAHIIEAGQHTNLWGLGGREIVLGALADIKTENK